MLYLVDPFTGTNGNAPDSTKWDVSSVSSGSTVQLQSGQVRLLTGTSGGYADVARLLTKLSAHADLKVEFDFAPQAINPGNEAYFKQCIRAANNNGSIEANGTCYRIEIDAGGQMTLDKGSGSTPLLSSVNIAGWGAGTSVHFIFSAIGSALFASAQVTGQSAATLTKTDSSITAAGYCGSVLNGGNAAAARDWRIDNYQISDGSSVATALGIPVGFSALAAPIERAYGADV